MLMARLCFPCRRAIPRSDRSRQTEAKDARDVIRQRWAQLHETTAPARGRAINTRPPRCHSLLRRDETRGESASLTHSLDPLHSTPRDRPAAARFEPAASHGGAAGTRRGRVVVADAEVQAVRGDDLAAVRVRRDERDHQGVAEPRHEPLRAGGVPPRLRHPLHRALRAHPRAQGQAPDDTLGLPPGLRPRPPRPRHRPELLLRRPQVHLPHLLLRHEQHAPRHDLRHGRPLQDGESEPEKGQVRRQGGRHPRHRRRRHAHDALQGPRRRDGLVQPHASPRRPAPGRRRRRQGLVQGLHLPHHCHARLGLPLHPPGRDAEEVRRAADPHHAHLLRGHPAGHRRHVRHGAQSRRLEDRLRHEPPRRRLRWYRDIEHCLLCARAGDPDPGPRLRLGLQPTHDDRRRHHGLLHPCREHLPRRDHRVRTDRRRPVLGALGGAQGERGEGDGGDGDPRGDQGHRRRGQRQDHGHRGARRGAAGEGPGERQGGGGRRRCPRRRASPDAAQGRHLVSLASFYTWGFLPFPRSIDRSP